MESGEASCEFLDLIPRDFARDHLIISCGREVPPEKGGAAEDDASDASHAPVEHLLVSAETNRAAIFNVGVHLGASIEAKITDGESIARLIDEAYTRHKSARTNDGSIGGNASNGMVRGLEFASNESDSEDDVQQLLIRTERELLSTSGKGPVVKLVDTLLFEALGKRGSDVHVQPTADKAVVRYRVDGVLHSVHELASRLATAVISRIKVMGRMDIAEKRIPQDGRATVTIGGRPIDLRISTYPTNYGERAVIRLLDNSKHLCDFDRLGMSSRTADRFLERASRSNGIILVTGPTGSGKTTTLYSTLRRIARNERNTMTIEDPIEYDLSTVGLEISQAQTNTKKGLTFATGLRHMLRQDPDIIMVGEIRDAETARIAIQASLTGHLVFSTLHTNDAPSAVTRLVDLGVEPYLVGASLSAVLAQRLVRLTHKDCDGAGCAMCLDTGLMGRTGVFELLVMNDEIRELVAEGATLTAVRDAAIRGGMQALADEGEELARVGKTTRTEIERVVRGF
jgi:general secretion pathway protein E